jgi:hypothetical protein
MSRKITKDSAGANRTIEAHEAERYNDVAISRLPCCRKGEDYVKTADKLGGHSLQIEP